MITGEQRVQRILRLYPDDCQPRACEPVVSAESFSGAQLWRVDAERGPLCLRQWPAGHPNQQRLEFIQAVLWHVDQEGFRLAPLPLETRHRHGYVWHERQLWELTPWLPGAADYRLRPSPQRLEAALQRLAEFHRAASTFPLPEAGPARSPGIAERTERLADLQTGKLARIQCAVDRTLWPELNGRADQLCMLFAAAAPRVFAELTSAACKQVQLQPCIRDVWHAHVLYVEERVSGIVDFGSMRPDCVATDVARLLGSLAQDHRPDWQRGLRAYQSVRPLSPDELSLIEAFDHSAVLMAGIQWLDWIYLERRIFSNPPAVLARIDEYLSRLRNL